MEKKSVDQAEGRVGTWPSAPLPQPQRVGRFAQYELRRDVTWKGPENGRDELEIAPTDGARWISQPLDSPETYLELEAIDLRRPDEVLGFVNAYGPLRRPWIILVDRRTGERIAELARPGCTESRWWRCRRTRAGRA